MWKWAPKEFKCNLEGQCCQEQDIISTLGSPNIAECQNLGVNSTGKSLYACSFSHRCLCGINTERNEWADESWICPNMFILNVKLSVHAEIGK